jgi:hypothetical protein
MSTAVVVARLNTTVTGDVLSGAAQAGSAVVMGTGTAGVVCVEAIGICHCLVRSSSGSAVLNIEGSVDGGTTWATLGTFGAVTATGVYTVRLTNTAPIVRFKTGTQSGTSNTCVIELIGLVPTDSYRVSDTAIVAA